MNIRSFLKTRVPSYALLEVLISGAFLAGQLTRWRPRSLDWEECRSVASAVRNLVGHQLDCSVGIEWGGFYLPFLQSDHLGCVLDYVTFPLFAVFGVNEAVVTLGEILLSFAAAVLASRAVGRLAGVRARVLCLFLILFHSSFYVTSESSFIGDVSTQQVFAAVSAFFFVRWLVNPGPRDAFFWGLMLGLGVYAKLIFFWQALAGIVLMAWFQATRTAGWRWGEMLAFAAGLAFSPYNLLNITFKGALIKHQFATLGQRESIFESLGRNQGNADYGFLAFCADRFKGVLASLTYFPQSSLPGPIPWIFLALALPLVLIVWFLIKNPASGKKRMGVGGWVFTSLTQYVGLCTPVTSPGSDHVLPVLIPVLMALAVSWEQAVRSRALWVSVLVLYSGHLALDARHSAGRRETDSTPVIADMLLCYGIDRPINLMSPGSTIEFCLATFGRVRPMEPTEPHDEYFSAHLARRETWFATWSEESGKWREGDKGPRAFYETARRLGKEEAEVRFWKDRRGTPLFKVFRMEDKGSRFRPRSSSRRVRAYQSKA